MPFVDLYIPCPGCGYSMVWGPGLGSPRSVHRRHTTKKQFRAMLQALERKKEERKHERLVHK